MKTFAPLCVCLFCVVGFMAACISAFLSPSGFVYDQLTTTTTTTTTVTTSEATTYVYAILVSETTTTTVDVQELPDLEEVIE